MYERCGNSAYNVTPQITKKIPPIPPPPLSLFLSPSPNLNIILDASAEMTPTSGTSDPQPEYAKF